MSTQNQTTTTAQEKVRLPKKGFDPTKRLLSAMGISTASAVDFIREDAIRNPVAKKFIDWWEDLQKNKRRAGRIDLCCREARIPADEIRGIVVRMWVNYNQELATVIQLNAMPEIVKTSVAAAQVEGNYEERLKHMESRGVVSQPKEGGMHIYNQIANVQPQEPRKGLPDFDEHMRQVTAGGQKQLAGEVVDAEIVE